MPVTISTGTQPQSRCCPGFLPLGNGIGKSVSAEKKKIRGHSLAYTGESEWQQQQVWVSCTSGSSNAVCFSSFWFAFMHILNGCRPTLRNRSDRRSSLDMSGIWRYNEKAEKCKRKGREWKNRSLFIATMMYGLKGGHSIHVPVYHHHHPPSMLWLTLRALSLLWRRIVRSFNAVNCIIWRCECMIVCGEGNWSQCVD